MIKNNRKQGEAVQNATLGEGTNSLIDHYKLTAKKLSTNSFDTNLTIKLIDHFKSKNSQLKFKCQKIVNWKLNANLASKINVQSQVDVKTT